MMPKRLAPSPLPFRGGASPRARGLVEPPRPGPGPEGEGHRASIRLALLLPLLAATAATAQTSEAQRYHDCLALVRQKPADGETAANAWRLAGGGARARQCLGLAYVAEGRYPAAATAFENGARLAETAHEPVAADLWAQAGNAALLAGDNASADAWLGAALVATREPGKRGAILVDRAHAAVALGKPARARGDLDEAVKLTPDDPDAWLLSATLARRDKQLKRAETDIAEAAKRAPNDPDVLLEQGNIAGLAGRADEAKARWRAAVKADPKSEAGISAAKALAANEN